MREIRWCVLFFLVGRWWIDGIGNEKVLGIFVGDDGDGILELSFVIGGEVDVE